MGDYVLYVHQNKINGKKYIGITNNPAKRWQTKGKKYDGCPRFSAAIKKYGWDNFTHEILFDGLTLLEANRLEVIYIAMFRTCEKQFGYNVATGGNFAPTMTGKRHSEKTKAKMREKALGRIISEKQRTEHSKRMSGMLVGSRNGRSRPVRCIDTGEVFESQRIAAKKKGAEQSKICLCCLGKRNHTHGLRWEYADNTED